MEIIFDENKGDTFCGKSYPVYSLKTPDKIDFKKLLQEVRKLIRENSSNKTILIKPEKENKYFLLFAALMGIEGYDNTNYPLRAVLKVNNFKQAVSSYRPYFFFGSAATYVLRLLQMDDEAMYKDIRTLGYLGLDIKTDYLNNTISLHLPHTGKRYQFHVASLHNTVILSSFIKMLSLLKSDINIDIFIILKMQNFNTKDKIDKDNLLSKLYWCASSFLNSQNTKKKIADDSKEKI